MSSQAFPLFIPPILDEYGRTQFDQTARIIAGVSLRAYIATKFAASMVASGCTIDIDKERPFQTRAATACMMADALIAELSKEVK